VLVVGVVDMGVRSDLREHAVEVLEPADLRADMVSWLERATAGAT